VVIQDASAGELERRAAGSERKAPRLPGHRGGDRAQLWAPPPCGVSESSSAVARRCPRGQIHLVLHNYATHKHPEVQQWLCRHPRFHLHFTPTSASWMYHVAC
jgi:hypothetical protein